MSAATEARDSRARVGGADRPSEVEAIDLWVDLDGRPVLRGVNLEVPQGARLALVGPNGAGKTTLIRTLAGLTRPDRGEVRIVGRPFGADPVAARRAVGMCGHQTFLYGGLTARENLLFYARLYHVSDAQLRADYLLELVGLASQAAERASSLSRGMAQRLSLARAIVQQPSVLLLDEPDAALDAAGLAALDAVLSDAKARPAVLLTTHIMDHALRFCGGVTILRGGRIVDRVSAANLDVATLRERYDAVIGQRAPSEGRDLAQPRPWP